MTALLADRVAALLVDRPDSTFAEIQRAIPCLTRTLEEILENPLFSVRDGRWRLGETRDPAGGARVSPSGLSEPPDQSARGRAARPHTQLALTGPEFWRGEAA